MNRGIIDCLRKRYIADLKQQKAIYFFSFVATMLVKQDSLDMVLTSRFQVPQVLGDSKALVGALGPKGPKVIKGRMGPVLLEWNMSAGERPSVLAVLNWFMKVRIAYYVSEYYYIVNPSKC